MKVSPAVLGIAAGALLSIAFSRLLPAGLESGLDAHALSAVFLLGIVGVFTAHKCVLSLADVSRSAWVLASLLGCLASGTVLAGGPLPNWMPVLSASACVYIALSTVVPRLNVQTGRRAIACQCLGLFGGVLLGVWS